MKYIEELGLLNDTELRAKGLIKSNELKGCWICKSPTPFIEFCSEVHICSEDCMEKLNKKLMENCE